MLAEELVALATLAGNTVVTSAVTDAWEAARGKFARLLGRGDPAQVKLTEQRLSETHDQVTAVAGTELERVRAMLAERWAGRLADLLEEDPGAEAELRTAVLEIQAVLPTGTVSATDHAVAAGRDVNISAPGGIAAGVIHGNVAPPNPSLVGLGEQVAAPAIGFAAPGAIVALDGVAAGQLAVSRRPEPAGQPVRLAPRPPLLAGREDLLTELHERLSPDENGGPRIVALFGLGGAGKTSMAMEYAHRHLADVGLAWQFPADDASVLAAGFGELAAQLGARDLADTRDPVASVHAVLAAYPRDWLLIFDNAPGWESVAAYLPPGGPGRVLITSQNPSWPPRQALDVPVLDVEVAAGFLVNRTGDPDLQAATDLATAVGGLPLALEQAAAYIQASGTSVPGYLQLFRQRTDAMLARGEPTGYSKTVATTWSLAFSQLEESAPSAGGLIRLLAYCAPEAIPLSLLLRTRPELFEELGTEGAGILMPLLDDQLAASDAIAALRRYSLVIPAGPGLVSVHRLVQAITIGQMPTDVADQWHQAAAKLIEAAIPARTADPEEWPTCAALLPHAEAALADDSPGMAKLANYLSARGSYAAAFKLQQRVLAARDRVLGPEDPHTLATRHRLADFTGRAGDVASARDQFAALLPIRERVLGPDHPDTLTTRNNAARWTGEAGDAASARDQYAELLPVQERILGPEHPDTLTTRNNIAFWTGEAGDAASARDQLCELLPVQERILGPEHLDTLTTRNNIAHWTGEAGDVASARDQLGELLPVWKRVLGPEHPYSLGTRHDIARWTGEAGDAASARDQYTELLPIRERVLGPEHPYTLTTRHDLADFTGRAGDASNARDQYSELLPIRERILGPEHPDSLTTRNKLNYWSRKADLGTSQDEQPQNFLRP